MKSILADTGPLYALQDSRDAHHLQASKQLTKLSQAGFEVIVCQPVLFESHSLILHRLGTQVAQSYLQAVRSGAGFLSAAPEDLEVALVNATRFSDQAITLTDHALAVLSERLDVPVWTFDHHFDVLTVEVWR